MGVMLRPLIASVVILTSCSARSSHDSGDSGASDGTHLDTRPAAPDADVVPPLVQIESGALRGVIDEGSVSFKGVPYAAPPTEGLRWRAPGPVATWHGVREASAFGPPCPQIAAGGPSGAPEDRVVGREDCLTLNIWSPDLEGGPYPVMVFLHGGSNNSGSTSEPISELLNLDRPGPPLYEGQRLAARGRVVVVTIQYRLGVLGFLIDDELAREDEAGVSGNYGVRDQIAALRWVQRNIALFAGDPARVTLFGQSDGARDVAILLASPLAHGLFQRAAAHSPAWSVKPQSALQPLHDALIEEMGCAQAPSAITCLRAKRAEALVGAEAARPSSPSSYPFHPSVDGYLLPESPPLAFARGAFSQVPFIAGTTEAEHSHWEPYKDLTRLEYEALMGELVGDPGRLDEALALYSTGTYDSYSGAFVAAYGDKELTCPTNENVAAIARNNRAPTFLYRFRQVLSSDRRKGSGAYHASDMLFLFQHMDGSHFGATDEEREVATTMLRYWAAFAANGDPGGAPFEPEWSPHRAAAGVYQSIEAPPRAGEQLKQQECLFWRHPGD